MAVLDVAHMIVRPTNDYNRPVLWQERFGLTTAEIDLAERLMTGATLVEAARARGVQESTARTQLKQILSKTACRKQSDLMRVGISLTPMLRN